MNSPEDQHRSDIIYKIEYDAAAIRDLKKLTKQVQKQVRNTVNDLAFNPRPPGCEPLIKFKGLLRVREGDFRVVYYVQDDIITVTVVTVADRKEVYKVLEGRYN